MFASAIVTTLMIGSRFALCSAEPQSNTQPSKTDSLPAQTNSVNPNVNATNSAKVAVKYQLTGAELYSINCNRCHPERYATEFTAAQWKTIMTHMRVRANLPAAQAKLILKFLQEDAGN